MAFPKLVPTLLALVPTLLFAAEDIPMKPTPAKIPKATTPTTQLVDKVIPAYGMTQGLYPATNRAATLYHQIHAYLTDVEAKVMAGELHRPPLARDKDKSDKKKAEAKVREPLAEEQKLVDFLEALSVLDKRLHPTDLPAGAVVPEQWYLDQSFSDLARAADDLRLGLSDDTYTNIDAMHQSWLAYYEVYVPKAREAKIAELMKEKKISHGAAEEELKKSKWEPPMPEMRADGSYPDVQKVTVTSKKAEPTKTDEAPAVQQKPEAKPEPAPEKPTTAPEPLVPAPEDSPKETPAPAPEATAPEAAPEAPATEQPVEAPAETPVEQPAPAPEATPEAAPAPEAQPETPPSDSTPPVEQPAPEQKPEEKKEEAPPSTGGKDEFPQL